MPILMLFAGALLVLGLLAIAFAGPRRRRPVRGA